MTRWRYLVLLAVTGCGRLLFDPSSHPGDAGNGDASGDAAPLVQRLSYIKAMNTDTGDQFGWALAMSDDGATVAVGAPYEDGAVPGIDASDGSSNGVLDSGAVYIFVRSGATWQQQAYIKPSLVASTDHFGETLALSGDGNTLAVGVANDDTVGVDAGGVYVFVRAGTTWSEQTHVTAANGATGDQFGWAVALSRTGDDLAVGAQSQDGTALDSGAVYVYTRASTTWSQQAFLKAWNAGASDQFGFSVALAYDGTTLAVSAVAEDNSLAGVHAGAGPFPDNNTLPEAGAAYVFTRSGTAWSQQAYIKPSNVGFGGDFFGRPLTLSTAGDVLACGSPGSDTLVSNSGAVWVFRRSGSTWTEEQELKASNPGDNDQFGAAVSLSPDGNDILAGNIYEDSNATGIDGNQNDNSLTDSGAAYLITYSTLTTTKWTQKAYIKSPSPGANDQFGNALAMSADHQTYSIAAVNEDSAATGIDGNPNDESAQDSGAIEISYFGQ